MLKSKEIYSLRGQHKHQKLTKIIPTDIGISVMNYGITRQRILNIYDLYVEF